MPAPLRRTNNEDDDAHRTLAQYTYTMTSAPFLEICTSVLRLDVRFVVLALARSVGERLTQLRHDTSDWTIQRVRYTVNQSAFCLDLFEFWT